MPIFEKITGFRPLYFEKGPFSFYFCPFFLIFFPLQLAKGGALAPIAPPLYPPLPRSTLIWRKLPSMNTLVKAHCRHSPNFSTRLPHHTVAWLSLNAYPAPRSRTSAASWHDRAMFYFVFLFMAGTHILVTVALILPAVSRLVLTWMQVGCRHGYDSFSFIQLSLRKFWFDSAMTHNGFTKMIQISSWLKMDFWNLIQSDSWLKKLPEYFDSNQLKT